MYPEARKNIFIRCVPGRKHQRGQTVAIAGVWRETIPDERIKHVEIRTELCGYMQCGCFSVIRNDSNLPADVFIHENRKQTLPDCFGLDQQADVSHIRRMPHQVVQSLTTAAALFTMILDRGRGAHGQQHGQDGLARGTCVAGGQVQRGRAALIAQTPLDRRRQCVGIGPPGNQVRDRLGLGAVARGVVERWQARLIRALKGVCDGFRVLFVQAMEKQVDDPRILRMGRSMVQRSIALTVGCRGRRPLIQALGDFTQRGGGEKIWRQEAVTSGVRVSRGEAA